MKKGFIEWDVTRKDVLFLVCMIFSNILCFAGSYIVFQEYWITNNKIFGIATEKFNYLDNKDNTHYFKSTLGKNNLQWTTECDATFNSNDFLLSLDITSGWLIDSRLFPFLIQFSKYDEKEEYLFKLVTQDSSGNVAYEYYDLNQDGEFDAFREVADGGEYINIEGSFLKVDRIEINNELSIAIMNGSSYSFINGIWQTGVRGNRGK